SGCRGLLTKGPKSAGQNGDKNASHQCFWPYEQGMIGYRKKRTEAQNIATQNGGNGAGQGNRDQAARFPFEKKEFYGKKNCGHRRSERRRHSACRACDK